MALSMDHGELYVVESQHAGSRPDHNIQKNKYSDWIQYAKNCDFNVAVLPLSDEKRAQWNHTAALEFFNATEGLPYGYHNFLFGWIDTPEDNYPPLAPSTGVPVIFSVLDKLLPETIDIFYVQAMNKHLGIDGYNFDDMTAYAAEQGLTLDDVQAGVEMDGWLYTGEEPRDGRSYVCSSYVVALYKAAGLFGDLEI
jgi:hypothetical protein